MEDGPLVDLTVRRRKYDQVEDIVDLTAEDEDIQVVEDSPPAKKQKHQEIAEVTLEKEKRAAPTKRIISKEMQTKISKVQQGSRLYLIQQKVNSGNPLVREFVILGANGNVYTVRICCQPSCDCEEQIRGKNNCEHIIFVYIKIFNLPANDVRIVQKALLQSELTSMFNNHPSVSPAILADPTVTEKYLELTRVSKKAKRVVKQKPIEGDCPVCFEKMEDSQQLVYCKYSCGNTIHADCFHQWKTSKTEENKEVRCIYCRAKWEQDPEAIRKAHMKDGYLNLSAYQQDPSSLSSIPSYLLILPQLLRLSRMGMGIPISRLLNDNFSDSERDTSDDDDNGEDE